MSKTYAYIFDNCCAMRVTQRFAVVPKKTLLLLPTRVISLFGSIEEGFIGVPLRHVLRLFGFHAADDKQPDFQPHRDIALQSPARFLPAAREAPAACLVAVGAIKAR